MNVNQMNEKKFSSKTQMSMWKFIAIYRKKNFTKSSEMKERERERENGLSANEEKLQILWSGNARSDKNSETEQVKIAF